MFHFTPYTADVCKGRGSSAAWTPKLARFVVSDTTTVLAVEETPRARPVTYTSRHACITHHHAIILYPQQPCEVAIIPRHLSVFLSMAANTDPSGVIITITEFLTNSSFNLRIAIITVTHHILAAALECDLRPSARRMIAGPGEPPAFLANIDAAFDAGYGLSIVTFEIIRADLHLSSRTGFPPSRLRDRLVLTGLDASAIAKTDSL